MTYDVREGVREEFGIKEMLVQSETKKLYIFVKTMIYGCKTESA